MLSSNCSIVLTYLHSYFRNNKKPITVFDIDINNLSIADVENSLEELSNLGFIKLNTEYVYPCVMGIK